MKKLWVLCFCGIILFSCDNNLTQPENQIKRNQGDVAIDMSFTKNTTSFQRSDTRSSNNADAAIHRSIPVETKEKVELKIFADGMGELFVEDVSKDDDLFTTDAESANDVPRDKYYHINEGQYSVYDKHYNLIFSQSMPDLNFAGILDRIKQNVNEAASLPAILSGGVIFIDQNSGDHSGGAFREENHPLHNSYDDNPDYEVLRETYFDEKDGKTYTQEIIVRKDRSTMEWVSLYDASFGLLSRTSFEYEGTQDSPQLVSTQDEHYSERNGQVVADITTTEYQDFIISLNL